MKQRIGGPYPRVWEGTELLKGKTVRVGRTRRGFLRHMVFHCPEPRCGCSKEHCDRVGCGR